MLVEFLRTPRRQVRGRFVLIRDRLEPHHARSTKVFLAGCLKIHTALLPPYAPEVNTIECVQGNCRPAACGSGGFE